MYPGRHYDVKLNLPGPRGQTNIQEPPTIMKICVTNYIRTDRTNNNTNNININTNNIQNTTNTNSPRWAYRCKIPTPAF